MHLKMSKSALQRFGIDYNGEILETSTVQAVV